MTTPSLLSIVRQINKQAENEDFDVNADPFPYSHLQINHDKCTSKLKLISKIANECRPTEDVNTDACVTKKVLIRIFRIVWQVPKSVRDEDLKNVLVTEQKLLPNIKRELLSKVKDNHNHVLHRIQGHVGCSNKLLSIANVFCREESQVTTGGDKTRFYNLLVSQIHSILNNNYGQFKKQQKDRKKLTTRPTTSSVNKSPKQARGKKQPPPAAATAASSKVDHPKAINTNAAAQEKTNASINSTRVPAANAKNAQSGGRATPRFM